MYYFRLLGTLEIRRDGELISPPPPPPTHGLLAALLLRPHWHARDRLAALLMPELAEQAGRRRLSDHLWLLSQALPQLPIQSESQRVCLLPTARRLDTEIFAELGASNSLQGWQQAIALYRGPLLQDSGASWLLAEQERLRLQQLQLLQRICSSFMGQQQYDRALSYAEQLVQAEPYDERALRTLMQIYEAVGRRGSALESYDRFVSLAASDLGIAPEPATQSLAQAIRGAHHRTLDRKRSEALDNKSPENLLHEAREALARADRAAVSACLQRLAPEAGQQASEISRLEIDLALLFDDYERAETLLAAARLPSTLMQTRQARLALGRRQTNAAHDQAAEALITAHQDGNQEEELEALLVLLEAQQQLGQSSSSARTAERALKLARTIGSPTGAAQALVAMGHDQMQQGHYERAAHRFYEARSLALEHSLSYHLASAWGGLRQVLGHQNRFCEAREAAQKELRIWRDLGLQRQEAAALEGLALISDLLGQSEESLRLLAQAQSISRQLGDPVRMATNQYHTACSLLYLDDKLATQAVAAADEAAAIFKGHCQPRQEAAALTISGYARWVAGQNRAAAWKLQQAEQVCMAAGEAARLPELLAYRGLAHLDLGDPGKGLALTRRAVLYLAQGEVSQEVVHEIYYARAMALFASGASEKGRLFLVRAYEHLLGSAAQLEDEPARQAFFRHNPTTRRLMQALYERALVPRPTAGVVTRWLPSTRDSRLLPVRWTVDAGPADVALQQAQGSVGLRRARLTRLLHEADAQGARPSLAQLAAALEVSKRTIQRDMAVLNNPSAS